MTYSNRTPTDRAALDAAVAKRLSKRGRTRGDITTDFAASDGVTVRMVSDALRRLVAAGKATRGGPGNAPTYSKAAAS